MTAKGTVNTIPQPPVLHGFSHVNRYWDRTMDAWAAKILPGEFYVSLHGELIVTVLGSCIAVCIRDRVKGIGGMNHFMLPEHSELSCVGGKDGNPNLSRYGNWAMEYLINEVLKNGGRKENLEVKYFGGGQVLANLTDIGQKNILFTSEYLKNEKLISSACDVGDIYSRKVYYFPDTGAVKLKRFRSMDNDSVIRRERAYQEKVNKDSNSGTGSVELF